MGRCRASAIAITHMRAHRAREKNSTRLGRVALTGGPVYPLNHPIDSEWNPFNRMVRVVARTAFGPF